MITPIDVARAIARAMDEAGIAYAVGGAVALGALGAPRATKDLDLSAFVELAALPAVFDALERAGVMLQRDDALRDAHRIALFRGKFGRMAIDVFVSEHPQYAAMRARRIQIDGLWILSPEDLSLHKLIFGRPKDVFDLERLFAARPAIDVAYIRLWLTAMVPAGDRRFALLDDLERRFVTPAT